MAHSRSTRPAAQHKDLRAVRAVDACTLGRPVHLLERYTEQLGNALGELFAGYNRRYRTRYRVGSLSIKPLSPVEPAGRWMVGETPRGRTACLIERHLVLALMAHRYGAADAAQAADSTEGAAPPAQTRSEERLQNMLCRQLLERALRLIEPASAEAPCLGPLQPSQHPQLGAGAWLVHVDLSEAGQGLEYRLLLAIGAPDIATLLQRLSQELPARAESGTAQPDPAKLPRQLQLKLQARLLEQQIPLGQLLDLRPGDLIPIRLKSTDVLVDGSRLFTASVAEHQGKLCLTSFADAD